MAHENISRDMLLCMRTTIELNDELLREVRRRAAREGTSLKAVIERALRAHLAKSQPRRGYTLRWHSETGTLQPGARLDDREALFDLMEGR
jgi:Arc/MetJ family transcription regulator